MAEIEDQYGDADSFDDGVQLAVRARTSDPERILLPCYLVDKPIFDAGDGTCVILDARLAANECMDEAMPDDMAFPPEWLKKNFKIVLRGEIESINPFVIYMISGRVAENQKYGQQFVADFYFIREIGDKMVLIKYLDRFPHLGRSRASEIVEIFGSSGLDGIGSAMENDGASLTVVNGITPDRAKEISKAWQKDFAMRDLYVWMTGFHLPVEKANDIFLSFGKEAKRIISENPYSLINIKGIGFKTADAFAHRIGQVDPVNRVSACARYILGEGMKNGDLCAMVGNLSFLVRKQLDQFKPQDGFEEAFQESMRKCFVMLRIFNKIFVYLPEVYKKEREAAMGLADIAASESRYSISEAEIDMAQSDVSVWTGRDIVLDQCQRDAVKSAFANRLTVITGGGGTGKSTICQCIKTVAMRAGLSTGFMAPTGAAAKVLTNKTGSEGMTIHRALGIYPGNSTKRKQECDKNDMAGNHVVVVDEFSMVGIDTVAHVVKLVSGRPHINLVLVGDPQQLPSVSPGNFLFDIISSKVAHVVELTNVHRQSSTSYIPQVADEMAKGVFEAIPECASDITVYDTENESLMLQAAMARARDYLAKNGTFDGFQMISSMKYKGEVSVESVNAVFQALFFNESEHQFIEYNHKKLFVGERVMQRVNDYNRNVFNGNIGIITDCGTRHGSSNRMEKFVTVSFANPPVNGIEQPPTVCRYVKKEIEDIMTCWCCTVHKFQGSQADEIVFFAPPLHAHMMKRELVYTAMTRASKMLHILGSMKLLGKATHVSMIRHRNTHTREMMAWRAGVLDIPDLMVRNQQLAESSEEVSVVT